MNTYRFDEIEIGMSETFEHVITESDMRNFVEITKDINPLHIDLRYANKIGFDKQVVYGMLTASLLSTLGGIYLPGKYCLIQQIEVKFVAPVFVGDSLTIAGIVEEVNESVRQAGIKVVITNQFEEKVVRGKMKVGFLQ